MPHAWRLKRFSLGTVVAAATCLSVMATAPVVSDAVADPVAGRISGMVVNSSGEPVAGIEVNANRRSGDSWTSVPQVFTDADGHYEFDGLASGAYRLEFHDYSYGMFRVGYVTEFYGDVFFFDQATSIEVLPGQAVSGVDAELETSSHISGTVTGGGNPLRYVDAVAYVWNGTAWKYETSVDTDNLGRYDLGGLARGTYRVHFDPFYAGFAHLPEYWDNASTLEDATDIVVGPEKTVAGIDADLPEGGHVKGTVTDSSGQPVAGIDVEISRRVNGVWKYLTQVRTDAAGNYEVVGLLTDEYVLRFDDWQDKYVREYWDNAPTLEEATTFHVTAPETVTGKDAQLTKAPPQPFSLTQHPAIAGHPRVGDQISAQTWQWVPEPKFTYRWLVDGVAVPGAVQDVFTPRVEDVSKMVQVELTGTLEGFITQSVLSEPAGPVAAAPPTATPSPPTLAARPTTSGTPRVGRPNVVTPGVWNPSDVAQSYQWLRDGVSIPGAKNRAYTPVPADLGRSLQAQVTASRPGGAATTAVTVAATVLRGTITNRSRPTLRGRVTPGGRLRVTTGAWLPGHTVARVQWYAGRKPIAGATSPTLRLTRDLARKVAETKVSVRLTISAPGYASVTRSLTAPGKVTAKAR